MDNSTSFGQVGLTANPSNYLQAPPPATTANVQQSQQALISDMLQLSTMSQSTLQQSLMQAVGNEYQQEIAPTQSPIEQMMQAIGNGQGSAGAGNELDILNQLASGAGPNANPYQELNLVNQLDQTAGGGGYTGAGAYAGGGVGPAMPDIIGANTFTPSFLEQQNQMPQLNQQEVYQSVGSFTITSSGDPHDEANIGGATVSQNNEGAQSDFVDANASMQGGYQVSTQVSNQQSNGSTYNTQVGVQVGSSSVSVQHDPAGGNPSVTITNPNGSSQTLSAGQSLSMPGGGSIAVGQDGTVTVTDNNQQGGTISTVISNCPDNNGQDGLNVSTSGSNVALGGYMAGYDESQTGSAGGQLAQVSLDTSNLTTTNSPLLTQNLTQMPQPTPGFGLTSLPNSGLYQ